MKKKKIIIISLVVMILTIIIAAILLIINPFKNTKEEIKVLAGEKVYDGVYLYKIKEKSIYFQTEIINDNIYYLAAGDDGYSLFKLDIYTNKSILIGTIPRDSDDYCSFSGDYIDCSGTEDKQVYDINLKKIYDGEIAIVFPYKDGIIKIDADKIYFNDKLYKTANTGLNNFEILYEEVFEDNLYIYYIDYSSNKVCFYNLEEDKCEDYNYDGFKRYDEGLYYYNKDKIYIDNKNTNKITEYANSLKLDSLHRTELKNNEIYYFIDDYFRIYNLENETVKLFDYRINDERLNTNLDEIVLDGDHVYLVGYDKIFLLDLNVIKTTEMSYEELDTELENRLQAKITNLKENYNIEVVIRNEADLVFDFWNQKMDGEELYDSINDALDDIEEVATTFGADFFKEFVHDDYKGIKVYIESTITAPTGIAGEAMRYYDNYAIISTSVDFKRTFYHELMHTLEDCLKTKKNEIFNDWDTYNPSDFVYLDDTTSNNYDYRYYPSSDEPIYFFDEYSQTNQLEDRARIFENLCMGTDDVITDNEGLLKKARYQMEEIIKYYPMLKDIKAFDNIKTKENESN